MSILVDKKGLVCVAALLLVLLGFILRLPGFDGRAFWVDELWRVNMILTPKSLERYWNTPDLYTAITSPMYLLLNNLIGWFSTSPSILRTSSLLPGLTSIVLAFAISIRASSSLVWASAIAALFAANTNFIQYSNEFKPYMLEVMVHMTCLYVWLDLIASKASTSRQWLSLSLILLFSAICASNIVFVLPAIILSLLDKVWAHERDKLKLALGVFSAVGLVVLGLYIFIWSYGSDKGLISYWAASFYDPSHESYLKFSITRIMGIWKGAFSIAGTRSWMIVISYLGLIFVVFTCGRHTTKIGITARAILIYSLSIIFTLLAINRMGLWPIGEIRPNQFLFAIASMLWALFLGALLPLRWQRLLGLLVLVVIAIGVYKTSYEYLEGLAPPLEQSDYVWESFTASSPAGKIILDDCKVHPVTVFIGPAMSHAYQYFSAINKNSGVINVLMGKCTVIIGVPDAYSEPEKFRNRLIEFSSSGSLVWHAYSHLSDVEISQLKSIAQEFGALTYEESFVGAGLFAVKVKKP